MQIVLTMAGKYSRFRLFGSKVPKYLLPLGSETMLSEVVKNLIRDGGGNDIKLIANRDDQIFYPILCSIMARYDIPKNNLIYIDDTVSQLETAIEIKQLALESDYDKPIAFANIDTILKNRTVFFQKLKLINLKESLIDTFIGRSAQYSYVRTDNDALVTDVVDKNIISNYACSGLYGFGSLKYMMDMSESLLKNDPEANFTKLYKKYIESDNCVVANHSDNQKDTIVLGTPEEYVVNIHRFK